MYKLSTIKPTSQCIYEKWRRGNRRDLRDETLKCTLQYAFKKWHSWLKKTINKHLSLFLSIMWIYDLFLHVSLVNYLSSLVSYLSSLVIDYCSISKEHDLLTPTHAPAYIACLSCEAGSAWSFTSAMWIQSSESHTQNLFCRIPCGPKALALLWDKTAAFWMQSSFPVT